LIAFLVTAEAYGIETVLVFNKIDTLDEVTLDEQLYMQHVYQQIGYNCLRVSSTEAKGIDKLKLMLDKSEHVFWALRCGKINFGKCT
jgi:ribosome biogenesis GTPase